MKRIERLTEKYTKIENLKSTRNERLSQWPTSKTVGRAMSRENISRPVSQAMISEILDESDKSPSTTSKGQLSHR